MILTHHHPAMGKVYLNTLQTMPHTHDAFTVNGSPGLSTTAIRSGFARQVHSARSTSMVRQTGSPIILGLQHIQHNP